MGLTFGTYAAPELARPIAAAAVVALTIVNYRGVDETATATCLVVVVVLSSLALVVVACLFGGTASTSNLSCPGDRGLLGVLRSAGLLFFAFTGYARIATLGEEVVEPERTIPRAVALSLALVLGVYALVAVSALLAVGSEGLARTDAPLAVATGAGSLEALVPAVRVGAVVASGGVLL